MKKQYLFSALAFSAFLASCSNEIETVVESVKQEAEMEEIVGADLVANGMTINVGGTESRAINGSWLATDQLALAWYNVNSNGIGADQLKTIWDDFKSTDYAIYANHKFTRNEDGKFVTESNVYQGGHFVYFPYKREAKVQQKTVKVNELAYTTKPENDPNPNVYEYDLYNKAFRLSAQDFIAAEDVDAEGKLTSQFVMSPMVNAINVHVNSSVEGEALKALEITKIEIKSKQSAFADEFSIVPANIPAVVREKNGTINETKTIAALDKYIADFSKIYKTSISRNVEPGFKLTEATNNLVLYTLPISSSYTGADKDLTVTVSVKSEYGITGKFTIAEKTSETETNNAMLKTLAGRLKDRFMKIYREEGDWTPQNTAVELTNDNVTITWNIANKDQWNDAVALASDLGKDVTFNLTGEVVFTESINLPEELKLTVVSKNNGKMVIDGDIEWPNTDDLDVAEANIVVEEDATLTINGTEGEGNRNELIANVVNEGIVVLNEYGTIEGVDNNSRIIVAYGSYVEIAANADMGEIAFNVLTETEAYKINNLISNDNILGNAYVNTLVVGEGNELNLNKKDELKSVYDPYTGTANSGGAVLADLSEINIELIGGAINTNGKNAVRPVNDITVKASATESSIKDIQILGDLTVEKDATARIDATPYNEDGDKYHTNIFGEIINLGTTYADNTIYTTSVKNEVKGQSKMYVGEDYTVWYSNDYLQGGLADGDILEQSASAAATIWDGTTMTEVTVNADGVYEINSAAELAWLAEQTYGDTKAGLVSKYNLKIELKNDLDMGNFPFKGFVFGMVTNTTGSSVEFEGNGHTISGLNLIESVYETTTNKYEATGLIAIQGVPVEVKNLNFLMSKANSANGYIGVVLGRNLGVNVTVDNVSVKNCEVSGLKSVAAISGHNQDKVTVTVKNSTVENCNITATEKRGAIFVGCYTSENKLVTSGNVSTNNTLTVAGKSDNTEYCKY